MRVFITGATGFIGTALTQELIAAGHQVLGLCRSEDKAAALAATGATVHRGSLEDQDSLARGAAEADAVVHLAFNHDFSRFVANCEDDRRAITTLAAALAGSDRPLIVTSGTAMANAAPGQPATEDGPVIDSSLFPRIASEHVALAANANVSIVRLPQVHDTRKQGLVSYLIAIARQQGVCAYVGDGQNRWPAAHVSDTVRLYRLALERAERGAIYHAVAEEGVTLRDITTVIGRRLELPVRSITQEQAQVPFGWLAHFLGRDIPASSAQTRQRLGWHPIGPRLLDDLERLQLAGE